MSAVASHVRPFLHPLMSRISQLARLKHPKADAKEDERENRDRRNFILEMMDAHPEAFQSELDCQSMMIFYSSRF